MIVTNKNLTTVQEKEKVLSQLEMKKTALLKKIKTADLSEDDFLQFLNLATKMDLVANAEEKTLQEIADEQKKQMQKSQTGEADGTATAAVVGGAAGGLEGAATFGVASMAAPGILMLTIGTPVAMGRWCWGKAKEIKRTFNASYQNDESKNRFGKALWRSLKYPLFHVPLINKMRQDMNFTATPKERAAFSDELEKKRIRLGKNEIKRLAKYAAYPALVAFGTMSMFVQGLGAVNGFDTWSFYMGGSLILDATILGAALGVCAYPFFQAGRALMKIEPKSVKGRRLIEQALNYPAVDMQEKKKQTKKTRDEVKAQLTSDKAKAEIAEKTAGKDDGSENAFKRVRNKTEKSASERKKSVSVRQTKEKSQRV